MVQSLEQRTQTSERPREASRIPGHWFWGSARDLMREGPDFLASLRRHGGVVRFRSLVFPIYLVLAPEGVRHILQENYRNYDKQVADYRMLGRILGKGLLTNNGQSWLLQRRLIQPAFHRQRLATFGTLMANATQEMLDRWDRLPADQPIDVSEEMMRLTMRIVGLALFSTDTQGDAETIGHGFGTVNRLLAKQFRQPFPPLDVPTRQHRELWAAVRAMDAVVYRIIAERRRNPAQRDDLLAMLMEARDAETGEGMSDHQVRDEVLTLLLAGHETTANALTWLWSLLAKHPSVEAHLHEELATVLAGAAPTVEQLGDLPYTRRVIDETLCLYPPAWGFTRRALGEDVVAGYRIPRHAMVLVSTYATHRDPAFWPDPLRFDPERFTPERAAERPRFAYFPFGGGPRQCIGNAFALMEAQIAVAMIAQRFQPRLLPGWQVAPEGLITLRPRQGMPMRLERRVAPAPA